ncbi:hypothetical protein RMCBS344292_08421 [Rhizopus microsporus]|nr:hypothetical protein RMCBS344292_08421 [Rhizopus microsporus]
MKAWTESYQVLVQMKNNRHQQLLQHQQRIQLYEQRLSETQAKLVQVMALESREIEKWNSLVESDTWVTAEEHERIHNKLQNISERRSMCMASKAQQRQDIIAEAQKAKTQMTHILGIERGLISLKKQIELLETKPVQKRALLRKMIRSVFAFTNITHRSIAPDSTQKPISALYQ